MISEAHNGKDGESRSGWVQEGSGEVQEVIGIFIPSVTEAFEGFWVTDEQDRLYILR